MNARRVYKYTLGVTDAQTVVMPAGAHLLSVQVQRGEVQVWALVDAEAPKEPRRFRIYGTGHLIDEPWMDYLGTFQLNGGSLVFHVFHGPAEVKS